MAKLVQKTVAQTETLGGFANHLIFCVLWASVSSVTKFQQTALEFVVIANINKCLLVAQQPHLVEFFTWD